MLLSYTLLPVGAFPNGATLSQWGLDRVVQVFALSFSLAAPFVIASFLYNLTLGVINRAMPQLMVAFVGAPVITAGGLLILVLSLPLLLSVWFEATIQLLQNPAGPLQ
jgi:flagellar biosynthetic protein FliR